MSEREDWNRQVIEEFRANEGRVGGPFENIPLLLLHHQGAKSGAQRVNPLAHRRDADGRLVVFASNGGNPSHPAWYHNLRANARVTVEVGTDKLEAEARVATGEEREVLWTAQKKEFPGFADYERKTTRQIPVVVLEPA